MLQPVPSTALTPRALGQSVLASGFPAPGERISVGLGAAMATPGAAMPAAGAGPAAGKVVGSKVVGKVVGTAPRTCLRTQNVARKAGPFSVARPEQWACLSVIVSRAAAFTGAEVPALLASHVVGDDDWC